MRWGDLVRSARAAVADRGRAALTLLGIVIGTSSIVLLAGLLRGGEEALMNANQGAMDTDLIQVRRDSVPVHQQRKTRRDLTRSDARILEESQALGGAATGSESLRQTQALLQGRKKRVTLVSAAPSALSLYRLGIAKGRFLDDEDMKASRRVCVVGHEVWMELLQGRSDITDTQITIDEEVWSVIGVLNHKPLIGATTSTRIWDRKVLVPQTTYDALLSPSHDVERIYIRRNRTAPAVMSIDALRTVIDRTLARRHFGVKNFKITDKQSNSQEMLILDVIKLLLFSTGLIALFVGGINIMNVMLVTVTERTREIGIRRAVGARQRDILFQFLVESAVVALTGGAVGVLLGILLSWLGALGLGKIFGPWSFYVEGWAIVLGLGLSLMTGIVFGLYPALRAARLHPIEALRNE